MKKILSALVIFMISTSLFASAPSVKQDKKVLILYFTRVGNTDFPQGDNKIDIKAGASLNIRNGKMVGNTEVIADMIQETIGGDKVLIQTEKKYPTDYDETVDVGKDEESKNVRPKVTTKIDNFKDYDTVFIGFPNWWGDLPMAVKTFIEAHDFSGKNIVPFVTSGGSGFSRTRTYMKDTMKGANILKGFEVYHTKTMNAQKDVEGWLKEIGMK